MPDVGGNPGLGGTRVSSVGAARKTPKRVLMIAVLCFALDRAIKRSERVIATVWNEPS